MFRVLLFLRGNCRCLMIRGAAGVMRGGVRRWFLFGSGGAGICKGLDEIPGIVDNRLHGGNPGINALNQKRKGFSRVFGRGKIKARGGKERRRGDSKKKRSGKEKKGNGSR